MREELFERAPVPKAVFTLALPTMLGMLVTIIYNIADTFFVGQTGDANQVAAVSLATPVFMVLMALGNIFGMGGSSAISRAMGAGNHERIRHASAFCFYSSIAVGALAMLGFLCGMEAILPAIGTSSQTVGFAREYLTYIGYGAVSVVLSFACGNLVRAEGAARESMIGMMVGTVTNIVLDPVMILWMDMGVAGAAIATVIGNVAACVYYLWYFLRSKTILSISLKDFSLRGGIPGEVFAIGLPASLNNVLMSAANIVLNNYLAIYGDAAVAAMGVAMRANTLVVMLQIGLAAGVQPLLGYNFGARNLKRMRAVMKFTMASTVTLGGALTLLYFLFTRPIIRVFIKDAAVVDYGVQFLRVLMVAGPVLGILFVFMNTFQAMGKALPSLVLSLSRQGLIFLPVIIIANALVGLEGIVWAQPVADLVSTLLAVCLFLFIDRRLRREADA
ncbi:MAG: MATE family efflux transporter [Oscillospiraceae bacterium]|nr:MATE family efflux transporter [Oscillospiraceae bacterium]